MLSINFLILIYLEIKIKISSRIRSFTGFLEHEKKPVINIARNKMSTFYKPPLYLSD